MKFSHITPTAYLDIVTPFNGCHLLLAHLVDQDLDYQLFFSKLNDRKVKILDNSAFELYKQGKEMFPSDQLVGLARSVDANYVVLTDYPGEPSIKTREKSLEMQDELREAHKREANLCLGTFYVPQSEVGDIDGLIDEFTWAATCSSFDYIGVSILAVPNAYGVEKGNKLQRFIARWKFLSDPRVTNALKQAKVRNKNIHLLGMVDGPNEIDLMKTSGLDQYIDTWDSSAAVWAGLNGIRFDKSPTGLINGKYEREVDFDHDDAEIDNIAAMLYNVRYINEKVSA